MIIRVIILALADVRIHALVVEVDVETPVTELVKEIVKRIASGLVIKPVPDLQGKNNGLTCIVSSHYSW